MVAIQSQHSGQAAIGPKPKRKQKNYEHAASAAAKREFKSMADERAAKTLKRMTAEQEKRARLQAQIEAMYPRNESLKPFAESIRNRVIAAKHMFIWSGYTRAE